jgi:hypothetical protein
MTWDRRTAVALMLALAGCAESSAEPPARASRVVAAPASPIAAPDASVDAAVDAASPSPIVDPAELEAARRAEEMAAFETVYPLHGVAYHFLAQVFSEPSNRSRVVGYMRRGSKFRAKKRVNGPGCQSGWYEIPGGGFVCRGSGYQLGDTPQTFEPSPAPPMLDDALPYPYARTARDDVPQFSRLPTATEQTEALRLMGSLRALDDRLATTEEGRAASIDAPPPPGQTADTGRSTSAALPEFLRMRMLRGFTVSLDRIETAGGTEYYRTVRGSYVEARALTEPPPSTMRGVVLGGTWRLPMGFVFRTGVHRLHTNPTSGELVDDGTIDRHTPMVLTETNFVRKSKSYVVSDEGVLVREPSVRIIDVVPRPTGMPAADKWIHVDLSQQSLVAYEGDTPVFVTLVSSGKEDFETPTGLFQVQSKHVSTTMDDTENPDGAYSIEDVPWTMYFQGNYALHGAFWHNHFGNVRSHGCVNMAPVDARWLFQWSTPALPASWHGVFADRSRPGTWVYVTE